MKIKEITSCIILATSSLWLTGCNGGSNGTPNSIQSNSSSSLTIENARQSTKSLNASIDEINTWWEVVQAEKKADAYQKEVNGSMWKTFKEKGEINWSLIGTRLGKVTSNLALNLLGQIIGFSSIEDVFNKLIFDKLFPSGQSQAEIFYQNIMNQLMLMDRKLDGMRIIGDETLQTIVNNQFNQGQRDIKSRYNTVDNDRADLVTYLNNFNISNSALGTLFDKGDIDFIESAGISGKYQVNGELLKLTMFVFADEHKDYATVAERVFNKERITHLDTVVQELSALDDSLLSSNNNIKHSNRLLATGADTLLVPTVMQSMSDYIVNKHQLAFFSPAPTDTKLDKDRIFINGQINTFNKNYNRLSAHVDYSRFLNGLSIQLLNRLVAAQRFQYISILFRYLGGDKNIYIPNKIDIALGNQEAKILKDESEARNLLKEDPKKAQEKLNSIADARKELFIKAIESLNSYYAQRGANVHKLISTPTSNTYGKLMFDGTIASFSGGSIAFFPTWDFIRGRGIFAESGNYQIHAVQGNSDDENDYGLPFYKLDGRPISISNLVNGALNMQPQIYWDGYYLKAAVLKDKFTDSLTNNLSIMQRIGDMCNTTTDSKYELRINSQNQLYCDSRFFKYDGLPLYDKFRTRNTAFIDLADYKQPQLMYFDTGSTSRGNVIGSNGAEYYAQIQNDPDPDTYDYKNMRYDSEKWRTYTFASNVTTRSIKMDMKVLYASSRNSGIHTFYLPIGTPFGEIFLRIENGEEDSFTSMTRYPYDVYWKLGSDQQTHEMAFDSASNYNNDLFMVYAQLSYVHGANNGWARHILFTAFPKSEFNSKMMIH